MSKVALIRCEGYEGDLVFDAVKRAVDLIGGISSFVKPGMKVLLKPNLLSPRPPEDAVDTHPEVVRAVVQLVKSAGGMPMVGDSPGGFGKNIEEVFEASGMRRMAGEEKIGLVKFTSSKFVEGVPISRYVFDSDCFISIPKIKTHSITILTAALKNTFGTVTGLYKAGCHSRAPHPEDFARLIAKIHSVSRPHLNIIDGITAMEGDGPSVGDPIALNLIMAGVDAVAIDSLIALIIGLAPEDILVTKEAFHLGLGEMDPGRIEALGDDINGFVNEKFRLPQTTLLKFIPKAIMKGVSGFVKFKPYIDSRICTRCNLCKISCPVSCITIEKDLCRIDYDKCVRCMCCHEVCPYKAISIKRNALTRAIWG